MLKCPPFSGGMLAQCPLSLNLEAKTKEKMDEKVAELLKEIRG